jgi:hypothetical protein
MPDLLCQACSAPITKGIVCADCAVKLFVSIFSDDPETLKCENCKAVYSASEPRVQRRLREIAAGKLAGESTTPMLCWVCSRLHPAAPAEKERWFTQ